MEIVLNSQTLAKINSISIENTLALVSQKRVATIAKLVKTNEGELDSGLMKIYATAVALQGKKDNPLNKTVAQEFINLVKTYPYNLLEATEIQTAVIVGMREANKDYFVLSIAQLKEFLDGYMNKRNEFFETINQGYE